MKAMVFHEHGGPEVLVPADLPDPEPGAMGEVCEVNVDTCIGCQLCTKFCPPDYDAVHMFPHDEGM